MVCILVIYLVNTSYSFFMADSFVHEHHSTWKHRSKLPAIHQKTILKSQNYDASNGKGPKLQQSWNSNGNSISYELLDETSNRWTQLSMKSFWKWKNAKWMCVSVYQLSYSSVGNISIYIGTSDGTMLQPDYSRLEFSDFLLPSDVMATSTIC